MTPRPWRIFHWSVWLLNLGFGIAYLIHERRAYMFAMMGISVVAAIVTTVFMFTPEPTQGLTQPNAQDPTRSHK